MIKVFIFTLAVCSMSYQQCRVIEEATIYFDNYRDCALHGYEYSYKLLEAFDPEILTKEQVYTRFACKELESSWQYGKIKVKGLIFSPFTYPYIFPL